MNFAELSINERYDELCEATNYLLDDYDELFSERDQWNILNHYESIHQRLANGKRNLKELSKTAEAQIVDEALQHVFDYGCY